MNEMNETSNVNKNDNENLTNIQMIVFEDEDGLDIEMEVLDEFEHEGKRYVALRPAFDAEAFTEDEDSINFFEVYADPENDEEEMFDLIEDPASLQALSDVLENRLMSRGNE